MLLSALWDSMHYKIVCEVTAWGLCEQNLVLDAIFYFKNILKYALSSPANCCVLLIFSYNTEIQYHPLSKGIKNQTSSYTIEPNFQFIKMSDRERLGQGT